MSEPGDEHLHRRGGEVIRALHGLVHGGAVPAGQASPGQALEDALAAWTRSGGGAMTVQLAGGAFYIGGELLRLDSWTRGPARALARRLQEVGVRSLELSPGAGRGDFASAFGRDVAAARAQREVLPRREYAGVSVSLGPPADERPGAEIARRAAALVDAAAAVGQRLRARQLPDLLPLRRVLMAAAEQLPEQAGAYMRAAEALLQAAGEPRDEGARAAALALDAMGFAGWTGLERAEVVELGLAATVSGVLAAERPEAAARIGLALRGTGASGEALVLSLYDARAARSGSLAGARGRLIALLERYQQRTLSGESPRAAAGALAGGEEPAIDTHLAVLYARWKLGWLERQPAPERPGAAPAQAPAGTAAPAGRRRVVADDRWMALPAGAGGDITRLPLYEE